jgi:hypothetical protein
MFGTGQCMLVFLRLDSDIFSSQVRYMTVGCQLSRIRAWLTLFMPSEEKLRSFLVGLPVSKAATRNSLVSCRVISM